MRRMSLRAIVPVALLLAATAACSKSNAGSAMPTAPSSTTSGVVSGGASISGVVVSGLSAASLSDASLYTAQSTAGRVTVSVNGTSISVTSDDNGNFVLQNVPPGTLTLTISGSGFSSQVTLPAVNTNDQLRITVRVSGTTVTIDDQELESEDKVEIEGQIGSVSGLSSTGGTIIVGRLNSAVLVTSATRITQGDTELKPNDLTVGLRVHVRATRSGATLTATVIKAQTSNSGPSSGSSGNSGKGGKDDDDDDEGEDDEDDEFELSGVIANAPTGSCPAISFTVGTTTVKTSASTKFDDTTCTSLAKGDSVSVEGAKQTDGSVLAKEVEKKSGSSSGKAEVTGSLSGLGGSCPAVTFTVNGTKVSTNGSTKYDNGLSCAALSSVPTSLKLEVEGMKQSDGSILASVIGKK